jgi:hypothetical protein
MYYGQIEEIWELDFHGLKNPLFCCNLIDAIKGVLNEKYGFISFDHNRQGKRSEHFMLTKHVAHVFCILDTTNNRLKVVIPRK